MGKGMLGKFSKKKSTQNKKEERGRVGTMNHEALVVSHGTMRGISKIAKIFSSYATNKLIVYGEGSTKMVPSFFYKKSYKKKKNEERKGGKKYMKGG